MRSAQSSHYLFYSSQSSRRSDHGVRSWPRRTVFARLYRLVGGIVGFVALAAHFSSTASASVCHGDPFVAAAAIYQLDPDLLRAITWVESRGIPSAVGPKLSGGHRAWGAAQINDIHLPELVSYGVTREDLLDPCVNLKLSAWVLANCIRSKGATWAAVGCYNAGPASSNTTAQAKYVRLVQRAYAGYRAQSAAAMSASGRAK